VEKYYTVRTSTRREKGEGNIHQEFVPGKMVLRQKKRSIIRKTIRIKSAKSKENRKKKKKDKAWRLDFGRDGGRTGASCE
jgi:hypothetical protein